MKLLVVEDEALVRRQLQRCLSRSGHAVEAVASGEEALTQVAQGHFDLALIDLGLPGMSGLELIRQLRAGGQRLPILILSSRCNWLDKVEGLAAGADDYLVKPFQFDELEVRLNALLRRACRFTEPWT
jgi:two-component system response regulator PhoP